MMGGLAAASVAGLEAVLPSDGYIAVDDGWSEQAMRVLDARRTTIRRQPGLCAAALAGCWSRWKIGPRAT
jgi:hypothetical protein